MSDNNDIVNELNDAFNKRPVEDRKFIDTDWEPFFTTKHTSTSIRAWKQGVQADGLQDTDEQTTEQ